MDPLNLALLVAGVFFGIVQVIVMMAGLILLASARRGERVRIGLFTGMLSALLITLAFLL